jgi:CelD/BcsL family acetyltransferase involved in cellulose biosynthesis
MSHGRTAFLPLAKHRAWIAGDCLVWIGSGKACSDDMGIVCEERDIEEAAVGFANCLVEQSQGVSWDRLDLDGVRANDSGMNCLLDQFNKIALNTEVERRASVNCWNVELKESWPNQYLAFSKRVRKLFRQCAGFHEGKTVLEIAENLAQSFEFVRDIEALHQARWEKKGIPGCFSAPHFMDFIQNAVSGMWTDGTNRPFICRLLSDDVPIAGAISFGLGDTLSVYLSGMNPDFSEIRPGWQMNFSILQMAIERGFRKVDMMRGDEEYKSWLGGLPSAQERWIITAPRWSSQLRGRVYNTAASVKHWAASFYSPASSH